MEQLSSTKAFCGTQLVYQHASDACQCDMTFAVFVPPQATDTPRPVLYYLSGLTCNHSNVMDKGEYRRMASELGLIIVCPDSSPRGESVPDEPDNWQFGQGAGFYLNATQSPYSMHYQMARYITEELPALINSHFNVDTDRVGIFGHSMGGHGAISLALKNPGMFQSLSAFAPIAQASQAEWSAPALEKYLGSDANVHAQHDVVALIEAGHQFSEALIDQGSADNFLKWLNFDELKSACQQANLPWTLRLQEGYDHSYTFISTFMDDHLRWHADKLS